MDILVINLMRLGDLVQSSPVLRGLRRQYPEARITLAVQDFFQETAELLPGVDRLLPFPTRQLAPMADGKSSWPEGYRLVAQWLASHLEPRPDLVVNLTPTIMGAILSYLCAAREVRGFTLTGDRRFLTRPGWMNYLMVTSRARLANAFNLVDIFAKGAGLQPDGAGLEVQIPADARDQAGAFLTGLSLAPGTSLVGLVPGASQPQRCWPAENFAEVGRKLLNSRPCHFFILGSRSERPLGEKLAGLMPPGTTTLCAGGTSIAGLTALISRLGLLITNDTGPMHLAAAVKTPVLAFFLAGARVRDTGPVGEGHLALEPRLDCHPCHYPDSCSLCKCHAAISPEAVAAWALNLLEKRPLAPVADASRWQGLQVYLSTFDPTGHHAHLPLIRRPLDRKNFWTLVHRGAWPRFLDGNGVPGDSLGRWLGQVLSGCFLPPAEDLGLTASHRDLMELLDLAAQGERLACRLRDLPPERHTPSFLWQQAEAIRGIDPELHRLAVGSPEIAACIEYYFLEQRGGVETDVSLLARQLAEAYRRLRQAGKSCLEVMGEMARGNQDIACYINSIPEMAHLVQGMTPKDDQILEVASCK
ncbi:MAG: glycosyltransferase family 9 protein [Deltaproteobacteria bacterium]|nr:MAG: glycosyltransferase family 9 protein [Deltaproteobacteria bacterium]